MTKKELKLYNLLTLGYILLGIVCIAFGFTVAICNGVNTITIAYVLCSLACAYQARKRMRLLEHIVSKS